MSRWMKYTLPLVLIATLLVLPSAQVAAAPSAPGYITDEFNSGTTINSAWTSVAPVSGQVISQGSGHVSITAVAGQEQTIYVDPTYTGVVYNAPRLMQPFGGTGFDDFGIEVKFDSIPSLKFQQEGIVLEKSPTDLLRLEFYSDGANVVILGKHIYFDAASGKYKAPSFTESIIPANQLAGAKSLYMKITRSSFVWGFSYKTDTMADYVAAPFIGNNTPPNDNGGFMVTKVGVYAGTSGSANPGFTANVDYFRNSAAPSIQVFDVMLPTLFGGK